MEAVLVLAGGAVDAAPTGGMVLPGDPAPGLDTGTAVTPGAPALPLLGAGGFVSTASWSSPSTTALDWTTMVVDPVRLAQPDADLLRHAPIFFTFWFWFLAVISFSRQDAKTRVARPGGDGIRCSRLALSWCRGVDIKLWKSVDVAASGRRHRAVNDLCRGRWVFSF